MDTQVQEKLREDSLSFNGRLKESKAFIDVLEYGLSLLAMDNIEIKKNMLSLVIKKTRTLERLMELGTKHAVQSSLYDLEQEGFITRKIKENIFSYEFNRIKILFKIQKDLESNHRRLKDEMDFYRANDCLFLCKSCKNMYEYTKAMENGFRCCGERMNSFDSTEIVQNIMKNMSYLENKLNSLSKI
ncbi:MAG: hypothetical protein HWN66_15690 [Candidatus Helarchaeota archaeon]|nr:hypothetical protein [Candidatus Helarchaeota archaeon]